MLQSRLLPRNAALAAGEITHDQLEAEQDKAVADSIGVG
jgi:hypothetical protein